LQIDRNDNLSMIQACNFSGTVSSLFSAILNGGTVCPINLASEGISSLGDFIIETGVTIFHSVPTIFESLILTGRLFPGLRLVRLEGDRVDPRHIELYNQCFDCRCQLAIGLGATETGLTRQYVLSHNDPYPELSSPIGYAVEGMDITLVNETGQEVKSGEPGEILVHSQYLATGYWQQPDLTEKHFLNHPSKNRIRSYRTDDIGRMLPDGCLLYLGRKDFQVKLRGISIETRDIEFALKSHPFIEDALVQLSEPRRGGQQLIAYLVMRNDSVLAVCEIRCYLSRHIPRSNLPPIHTQRPTLQQPYEPATTELQITLVRCFEEVLSVEHVGIHDNFYDLGGDSLLAMQLLLLVEEKTGLAFPESKFFESPTIKTIEKSLVQKPSRASIITMQPLGNRSPLFCLHNPLGIAMLYRNLARLLQPDIPVLGVQAANIPEHITATSIESMAAEYLPLIQEKQKSGPYYLCGNCFDGLLAFEIAQLLVKQGEVVAFLGLIDTAFPMGSLRAAARRVTLSERPGRVLGLMFWNKLLHIPTVLFKPVVGNIGHRLTSQKDEEVMKHRTNTHPLSGLSIDRTRKLMESAGAKYRPKPYPGQVTLFHTGAMDSRHGWHRIANGGYLAIQLPTKFNEHLPHLLSPPLVEELAKEVRQILKKNDL
jgi:thioesterase domain-containing protein/acyl carrier protein